VSNPCFAQAEKLDPRDPRWPYLQGTGLISDDPEVAVGHLQRAVALCGDTPDAPRLTLAEVCLLVGRLDEAESHFRQALAANPGGVRANLGLGRLALERGRPGDAVGPLEQAAAGPLAPRAARSLLAQARQQLGDAAAADREREQAQALPGDPPWPDPFQEEVLALMSGRQARLSRLQTLHRQGRSADALALARQLEQEYPDLYWLVEARGRMGRGDLAGAETALRKAVELAPESVEAHFDLATVLAEQRNLSAATTAFRRVTELEPGYGPAFLRLGHCLLALGDRAAAVRAFEAAVRTMPQQPDARRDLAAALAQDGRPDEAAAQLRYALQLNPKDAKAREMLDGLPRPKP
jgi:tetratricopeptide (TPR) repeat protein